MNNTKTGNYRIFAIHIIIWGVLFISPYLLASGQFSLSRIVERSWLPLLSYAIIFYLNYFLFINKFLFQKKTLLFILINIILIILFVWIKQETFKIFAESRPPRPPKFDTPPSLSFFIYIDSISLIIPIVFAIATRIGERWLKTEAEKKEIENMKLQTELQHLKYQIQPHFFFNSLNNIYSLVDISPEKAKETLHSLSKLMRYLLYDSNTEKVSLAREIDFMNNYIELMQVRLTEKTRVQVSFPQVDPSVQVPPLLFISIIENAFKHGISATQESNIEFLMTIENKRVHFLSKNRNFPKNDNDKSGSGIGIQNLKKRLDLLYPNRYVYTSELKNEDFIVNLSFDLD